MLMQYSTHKHQIRVSTLRNNLGSHYNSTTTTLGIITINTSPLIGITIIKRSPHLGDQIIGFYTQIHEFVTLTWYKSIFGHHNKETILFFPQSIITISLITIQAPSENQNNTKNSNTAIITTSPQPQHTYHDKPTSKKSLKKVET